MRWRMRRCAAASATTGDGGAHDSCTWSVSLHPVKARCERTVTPCFNSVARARMAAQCGRDSHRDWAREHGGSVRDRNVLRGPVDAASRKSALPISCACSTVTAVRGPAVRGTSRTWSPTCKYHREISAFDKAIVVEVGGSAATPLGQQVGQVDAVNRPVIVQVPEA